MNPWTKLATRHIYANPWIRVREDEVVRPDGKNGVYGVVEFLNIAVGIVAYRDGDVFLVGQYRYPLDRYSWEIPEGGCPAGEEPLAAAQRELREETGISARAWELVGTAHLSNSVSDERAMWYVATDLEFGEPDCDGTERLVVRRISLSDALFMVRRGEITDAISVMAILEVAADKEPGLLARRAKKQNGRRNSGGQK